MIVRKTRVLHIVNNLNYGGMEHVVAELARRTDSTRFDTHVMALGYMGHFGAGLDTVATLHVAQPMAKWSMLYPRALAQQIRAIAPDVVHLHSGVLYKASLAASLASVPYQIYTDHGRQHPDPWLHRMLDRRASRRVDVIVTVSDPLREHMARIVHDASTIHVVHNGVDSDRYTPRPDDGSFRRELGVPDDVPIIGSIGRLETVKGFDVLIAAFAKLLASWTDSPKPALVLVGDGSERPSLVRAVSQLGMADSVHFLGWRSDIERIESAFTIFTMASRSEGTSVSLLEAMSAGLCPVVTDVGGNAAVLGPDLTHRLVAPSDPDALALALSRALRDAPERERDAHTARARVVERFGLGAMVRRYESLYSAARGEGLVSS